MVASASRLFASTFVGVEDKKDAAMYLCSSTTPATPVEHFDVLELK